MTALLKPVSRSTKLDGGYLDVVVTLYQPSDTRPATLGFREKGRRTEYTMTLTAAFHHAAKLYADRAKAEKKAKKKRRTR